MNDVTQSLVDTATALDDLFRERVESFTLTAGVPATVTFCPASGCGEPRTSALASSPSLDVQVAELESTGLLGELRSSRTATGLSVLTWAGDREAKAWRKRIALSLQHPSHEQLLRRAGQLKLTTWRLEADRAAVNEAIWQADGAVLRTSRSDLLALAQVSRSTFYNAIESKPADLDVEEQELPFEELPYDDTDEDIVDKPHEEQPTPAEAVHDGVEQPVAIEQIEETLVEALPDGVELTEAARPERREAPAQRLTTPVVVEDDEVPRASVRPARKGASVKSPASSSRQTLAVAKASTDRFSAPAAVLDDEAIYFADGTSAPWSALHIGDLALLAQKYRLGWGGGEDRLPDLGQVWLEPSALEKLEMPTSLGVDEGILDQARWAREIKDAFTRIAELPAFALAGQEGWEFTTVHAWTRVWHPQLMRAGVWIVTPSWQTISRVALTAVETDGGSLADELNTRTAPAPVLAKRLRDFAVAMGVAYRITPAATGLDLIDHTRPPRRDQNDDRGTGRNRSALVRGVAAEVPGFLRATDDTRFANLEADFSWWRAWESLTETERSRKFVVAFDRGRSYLSPWSSISLGVEGLIHHTQDVRWNGKEEPGYWLIDSLQPGEWPWSLPDLGKSAGAHVEDNLMWVTTHTLRQMDMVGITPRVHEAYTWDHTARYLEPAAKQFRQALEVATDPAVVATIKNTYTSTVGKLGQRDHASTFHLWRPDWRHHIIAATRTAILRGLLVAQEASGAIPLVVDRDTVMYAADTDDVRAAWPGDPKKLGVGIGAWKPAYIADLATWGPTHLPSKGMTGRFRYNRAVDDMTAWKDHQ